MDITLIVTISYIMWYSPAVPRNLILYHKQTPCLNFRSRMWPYPLARHKTSWQFERTFSAQASYMEQMFRFGWRSDL